MDKSEESPRTVGDGAVRRRPLESGSEPDERAARRTLAEQRLRARPASESGGIPRRLAETAAPLSAQQSRLWVLHRLAAPDASANSAFALRLTGALDVAVLHRALGEVVRRHDILRTIIVEREGRPVQVVCPFEPVPLPVKDLRATDDPAATARERCAAAAGQRLDPEEGPIFCAHLLRLGDTEHVLEFVVHHSAFDGWSAGVLTREVAALYDAFLVGRASLLPPLPVQYSDFAAWQSRRAEEDAFQANIRYWQQALENLPIFTLPGDAPTMAALQEDRAQVGWLLPPGLVERARTFSREAQGTLFMTLLAAFQALMARWAGQDDVVLGTPVSGRTQTETEGLIGCFMSMLVLRQQVDREESFRTLVGRVRTNTLQAIDHQEVPLEKLAGQLWPSRNLRRAPLFNAVFHLRNFPVVATTTAAGLQIAPFHFERTDPERLDLRLDLEARDGGLYSTLYYAPRRFRRETVEWLAEAYTRLLEAGLAEPDRPLGALFSALPEQPAPAEASSGKATAAPVPSTLDELFEASNLTRRQLLVYIDQKLVPDRLLYDVVDAVFCDGLDPALFQRVFQVVLDACDALRTVFEEHAGVPYQWVQPPFAFTIPRIDLRDQADPSEAAKVWMQARTQQPLDMTLRVFDTALLQVGLNRYIWYINVHHIVCDGWAIRLLVRQVVSSYRQAEQEGVPDRIVLPAFHQQVVRKRAERHTPAYRAAAAYWRACLAGPRDPLVLYGTAMPSLATRMSRHSLAFGAVWAERVHALVRRPAVYYKSEAATRANVFAALLVAYLHRITGADVITLGINFHNRADAVQRQTIGLLMEVLPVTVTVDTAGSFEALVREVHRAAAEALAHRSYSVPNPVHAPAYEVMLNVRAGTETGEAQWPVHRIMPEYGTCLLSLEVKEYAGAQRFEWMLEFSEAVFAGTEAQYAVAQVATLMDAALAEPDLPLSRLPLLADAEREQLLDTWNQTRADYPRDACLHEWVAAQAARTPEPAALRFEGAAMTYRELDAHANRLAHTLRGVGVGPEVVVGICMERSFELVVGLLGILKAGGAYLPLDPDNPPDRLAFMVSDATVRLVLTQAHVQDRLPGTVPVYVLDLHRLGGDATPPVSTTTAENLAYVLYTSGSTGQPKGVMITHRSVVNFLSWRHRNMPLSGADRMLQRASIGFDDSVKEFFEPLTAGACLVLARPGGHQDPAYLTRVISDERVTALCLIPSMLRLFLQEPSVSACTSLRRVTTGGEVLAADVINAFYERLPQAVLYNGYGPTETTIAVSYHRCAPGENQRDIRIGRPIDNVLRYVLDAELQPVPIGVPGELYIGGDALARGYIGHSAAKEARFIPDPFDATPGARLYRTGDRVRYLPDGSLVFMGRLDRQVKLRGFRIEPGEIEAVLQAHEAVREAAVVLHDEAAGGPQLVAYVVWRSRTGSTADLRPWLRARLPSYMVPAVFVEMEALPRTTSGKPDHRSLPAPEGVTDRGEHFEAVLGPIEQRIAAIWQELLGLERVGRNDDFFDLGGHSLLAVQAVARLRKELDIEVPLHMLFETAVVAALAEKIEALRQPAAGELAALLDHVERLSDEEANRMLHRS